MAIPKIRAGNDFVYVWAIERNGVAVDLTAATIVRLSYGVGKPCNYYTEIPFEIIDGNKVRSSHNYENTGTYNFRLEFTMAGVDSTVDIDAFVIVGRTALASEATDFAVTSDMAIGFKGDPLTYDDLTPEQIAELQQPATDAIASIQEVELAVETAEGLRVQAELNRQTNTATAISNAEQATDDANEKAGLANDAAILANEKAGLAATATTEANAARDGANSAAQAATNLVDSYATELAAKELKANKQNNLAPDGTGTKFPTVDAVNGGLSAAVGALLANYTHIGNREAQPTAIDLATGTFTAVNHGFVNGNRIAVVIPRTELSQPALYYMPTGLNPDNLYYVVNADVNTFKLSSTVGGAAITYTVNSNLDITKFYFELPGAGNLSITNILPTKNILVIIEGKFHGGYMCPNGFGNSVNIFYQDGQPNSNRYNPLKGHKIYGYNEICMSTRNGIYIKEVAFAINSNSVSTNTVNKFESHYYAPSIEPFDITSIIFANSYIQNGLSVKIYKA
jgi:hypothetical protein